MRRRYCDRMLHEQYITNAYDNKWTSLNKLTLNISKTKCMIFNQTQNQSKICMFQHKILTLKQLAAFSMIANIYKIKNKLILSITILTATNQVHTYNTRTASKLYVPPAKTKKYRTNQNLSSSSFKTKVKKYCHAN